MQAQPIQSSGEFFIEEKLVANLVKVRALKYFLKKIAGDTICTFFVTFCYLRYFLYK